MAGGRIPLSALYWPVTVQQVAALTVHGALRHAARHPAGKIAVACIQPLAVRRLFNGLDALQFAADFTVNCNGASGNDSVNGNPDIDFVSQKIIINTGVQKNTVM